MTDKFDAGGGIIPPTTEQRANALGPGVTIKDSTGRLATNLPLDSNGRAVYTKTLGENDLGVRTMNSSFTSKPGTRSNFTQHVLDDNGNLSGSLEGTVNQVVAGPGVYISSPNGQGVVTVSLTPIPTQPTSEVLFDISWSQQIGSQPYGVPGQFIAVGRNGINMRSRDGVNWVQMQSSGVTMLGGSAELNSTLTGGLEYNGVGANGASVYGRLGLNGDAMLTVAQLSDQNGLITERFISTLIFPIPISTYAGSGGTPGGGGTGGGTIPTQSANIALLTDFDFDNTGNREVGTYNVSFLGESEGLSVKVRLNSATGADAFGLANPETYSTEIVTSEILWDGVVILPTSQANSWEIGEDFDAFTVGLLISPINLVPRGPNLPGILFTEQGTDITFAQGETHTLSISLYVTDQGGTVRKISANKQVSWI